jgi:hypothetical protein
LFSENIVRLFSQLKKANTDKKELNSQMKELNHQLRRETAEKEKLRQELLEARSELESARKRPALTGFGDSPASKPGRKQKYSMGFSFTAQMEEQQLEETPEKQEEDSDIQVNQHLEVFQLIFFSVRSSRRGPSKCPSKSQGRAAVNASISWTTSSRCNCNRRPAATSVGPPSRRCFHRQSTR